MNPRFYIDAGLAAGQTLALPEPVVHHARRVLRLREGEAVTLFNGRGGEYAATLRPGGLACIDNFDPIEREAPLAATLVQAWVAVDKLDWIVEKATELGAARIVLAPTERSLVRLTGERLLRRLVHLRAVAQAACCQCGRNRLPLLDAAASWAAALSHPTAPVRLLLDPQGVPVRSLTMRTTALAVAVGPEGGLTDSERLLAQRLNWQPAQLGPRVLRTETAGLAALALVLG